MVAEIIFENYISKIYTFLTKSLLSTKSRSHYLPLFHLDIRIAKNFDEIHIEIY